MTVTVRLKPRSRETGADVSDSELIVRVKAQPIEGRANAEALAVVAEVFGVPKSRVELVSGARSRVKRFRISEPSCIPSGLRGYRIS